MCCAAIDQPVHSRGAYPLDDCAAVHLQELHHCLAMEPGSSPLGKQRQSQAREANGAEIWAESSPRWLRHLPAGKPLVVRSDLHRALAERAPEGLCALYGHRRAQP